MVARMIVRGDLAERIYRRMNAINSRTAGWYNAELSEQSPIKRAKAREIRGGNRV